MERQEGYYWVKYEGNFKIAEWYNINEKHCGYWMIMGNEIIFEDSDFEHINEVRIKQPGELPE